MTRCLLLFVLLYQVSSAQRISRADYLVENSAGLAQEREKKRAFELPAQAIDGRIAVYMALKAGESKVISVHRGCRSKAEGRIYRLPTMAECEFAARAGSAGAIYPWGTAPASGKANFDARTVHTPPATGTRTSIPSTAGT